MRPLPRAFYARPATTVARELIGKLLVHRPSPAHAPRVGRIVETEAYLGPHDAASHSRFGLTKRNRSMFGPPGHAYVYLVYGVHECLNVVTDFEGAGAAVLIRALEPVSGCPGRTSGPGLLTRAMGITRAHDGHDLVRGTLSVADDGARAQRVVARPRVGIGYSGRWAFRRLRFLARNNEFVSRRRT